MNLKHIHIGESIKQKVEERKISINRICNFLDCTEEAIEKMYLDKGINTEILLRWSKLLEYDFFRLYVGHLILYSPPSAINKTVKKEEKLPDIPLFRKNIYTQEIKDFILNKINTKELKPDEVIEKYKIPKTTLYRWIRKK